MEIIDLHRPGDGRQDLTFVLRDPIETFRTLVADPRAKGHQYFSFELYLNERNEIVFYHPNGALVYQKAQLEAGVDVTPLSLIITADGTYGENSKEYRTVYGECKHVFILYSCNISYYMV